MTFSISVKLVVTVAVSSLILSASSIIIYELWVKSGIQNAKEEQDYIDLLQAYNDKSININSDVMQNFIEAEKERRYEVEKKKLETEIDKVEKIISHISTNELSNINKLRLYKNKKKLNRLQRHKDNIVIDMPYSYSEQFDQLRYASNETDCKEYKPNDTVVFLRGRRIKKYTFILTTTLIGLNGITISVGGQNWLISLFMTIISAIALIGSLVSGFSTGYNSIAVSSTGVYRTAIDFINKAESYCKIHNLQLRDIIEEQKVINSDTDKNIIEKPEEIVADQSQISMDIFNKLLN